jgi:hypothetical protein
MTESPQPSDTFLRRVEEAGTIVTDNTADARRLRELTTRAIPQLMTLIGNLEITIDPAEELTTGSPTTATYRAVDDLPWLVGYGRARGRQRVAVSTSGEARDYYTSVGLEWGEKLYVAAPACGLVRDERGAGGRRRVLLSEATNRDGAAPGGVLDPRRDVLDAASLADQIWRVRLVRDVPAIIAGVRDALDRDLLDADKALNASPLATSEATQDFARRTGRAGLRARARGSVDELRKLAEVPFESGHLPSALEAAGTVRHCIAGLQKLVDQEALIVGDALVATVEPAVSIASEFGAATVMELDRPKRLRAGQPTMTIVLNGSPLITGFEDGGPVVDQRVARLLLRAGNTIVDSSRRVGTERSTAFGGALDLARQILS